MDWVSVPGRGGWGHHGDRWDRLKAAAEELEGRPDRPPEPTPPESPLATEDYEGFLKMAFTPRIDVMFGLGG